MKQNSLYDLSYRISKTNRMRVRHQLFQKNRQSPTTISYLLSYDTQTQQTIKNSLQNPIPPYLLSPQQAVRSTISYYRRNNQFVYKIKIDGITDLHMLYESLSMLAEVKDLMQIPKHREIIQQFQNQLHIYLKLPYPQIRELAIIVAGNQIIGKQQQILDIINSSDNYLWILVNHTIQSRLSPIYLLNQLPKNNPMIYRCIFQISNNSKHQMIHKLINNEDAITVLMDNMCMNKIGQDNQEIQSYSIRIIGNVLAEMEDYGSDLTKWHLVDRMFTILGSGNEEIRRDGCWLLANYVFEPPAAQQILAKHNVLERILIMFKSQQKIPVRIQLYYILSHLFLQGSKPKTYALALQQNLLSQCSLDLDIQTPQVTIVVLNLILQILKVGQQFIDNYQQNTQNINQFSYYIKTSSLKQQITSKSFHQNSQIAQLSLEILELLERQSDYFGMM